MELTKEQIMKAMECGSVDELLELAKAEGVDLSREDAEKYYAQLSDRELSADELEIVAGGGGKVPCKSKCQPYCSTENC